MTSDKSPTGGTPSTPEPDEPTPSLAPGRIEEIAEKILGGPRTLTMLELAEQAGVEIELARTFWRGMGFKNVAENEPHFVAADVDALRKWKLALATGRMDETTLMSLLRAQSYTTDRMALWQVEAMVDTIQRQQGLEDTAARTATLEILDEVDDFLAAQLDYTWRRHLVDLAERTDAEIRSRLVPVETDRLPLPRALGFVDMVSFTSSARQLGSRELAELVQGFEFTARDVITANGARVVKTAGDAVLYIADDVLTGARVSLAMIDAISSQERLLPVRASLVWGRVVSRSGDIFGPAVNLASRLVDIAPRNTLYTDASTAALLSKSPHAADFLVIDHPAEDLPGIGDVAPVELRWSSPEVREDVWIPGLA
ncbi:adenylate cyclase [Ruaniaceae bacterium KH17]|nr:adenylate cyclase [Ruaniaceae bacterium KH17]